MLSHSSLSCMGFAAVFFSQHLLVTNISVTCFDGVWVGSKQPPPRGFTSSACSCFTTCRLTSGNASGTLLTCFAASPGLYTLRFELPRLHTNVSLRFGISDVKTGAGTPAETWV